MKDVEVEALFPSRFAELSVEKFMNSLHELDDDLAMKVCAATGSDLIHAQRFNCRTKRLKPKVWSFVT